MSWNEFAKEFVYIFVYFWKFLEPFGKMAGEFEFEIEIGLNWKVLKSVKRVFFHIIKYFKMLIGMSQKTTRDLYLLT